MVVLIFFFKQKTAYEMRISDWSSDVCSSDLGERWRVVLRDGRNGTQREVLARALVNAAGPWTAEFIEQRAGLGKGLPLRLVKGSHIVVPRLFEQDRKSTRLNSSH